MSVNFEANLSLDISMFMRNLKTAENAFDKLAKKIQNTKLVVTTANATTAGTAPRAPRQSTANVADDNVKSLARERYALYDVAAAYQQVAGAGTAALTAMVGAASQYERSFADVVRTTDFVSIKIGEAARVMRTELMNISTEIPLAFGQITEIATIGNQLGIAQGALEDFTTTVAKFAATTDVSTENAAMSFGRIGELLDVEDFNALGSAIAYAGVNAVATETQILATSKEIATTAKQAKFAAPDVIGLATALSSLGIAPEAARGSVIRAFAGINKAISEGGTALSQYATLSGMTADQFSSQWQQNGQVAFDALLKGLQAASDSGSNLDTVLRDLGVKNVRDIQTLQKLGDNYDVYAQSIRDANSAFEEGTFLSEAYGVVQETLASRLQILTNNWNNLLATLGEGATGDLFKSLIDSINTALSTITKFMKTPLGQAVMPWVLGSIALATAIAGVNAVAALARASVLAYGTAMGVATQKTVILKNGTIATRTSINAMAVASRAASVALKSLIPLAIISAGISLFGKLADSMAPVEQRAENMLGGFGGLQDALSKDLAEYNAAFEQTGTAESANEAAGIYGEVAVASQQADEKAASLAQNTKILADLFDVTSTNASAASNSIDDLTVKVGSNTAAWLRNSIVQTDIFKNLLQNDEAMQALAQSGFTLDEALEAQANGNLPDYMNTVTETALESGHAFERLTSDLYNSGNIILQFFSLLPRAVNEVFNFFGIDRFPITTALDSVETAVKGAWIEAGLLGPTLSEVGSSAVGAADDLGELEESANGVAKQLRTVLDYADDLKGPFDRIRGIRFDRQTGLDEIASAWADIAENGSDAEEAIRAANAEIQDITADKAILEYQLAVAERYGDEVRAAKIRSKLAKSDESMTKANKKLTDAQESQSRALEGNSSAAISNRSDLTGLVGTYEDYIIALVESGLKGKDLEIAIAGLKDEFYKQGEQMGFAKDELEPYADAFDDFVEVVQKLPRDVDIEFNSNISAAQQALNEYFAKLKNMNGYVSKQVVKTVAEVVAPAALKPIIDGSDVRLFRLGLEKGLMTPFEYYKAVYGLNYKTFASTGIKSPEIVAPGAQSTRSTLSEIMGFASGGLISGSGSGTSDSVLARVSNGEFVMTASAVGKYGVDFMNALNQQKVSSFATGGPVGATPATGMTIAQLSPEDRALLRAVVDRPVNLYADSTKIAQSANTGNTLIARRGSR